MPGGYMGKMLFIDLAKGTAKGEALDEKLCRDFIGGVGMGVRVLYERMRAGVDPLSPDNMLGFVTGPLTGIAPFGARYMVVAKSPLTGTWGDANAGGYFGPELKRACYDAVFFTGISPKPVYLLIRNGEAELKDASHLWGKDTFDTETALRRELGDEAVTIACIGPSGESQSLIAAIINDRWRAAARSGLGAVMGSKRLKAIAVRGNGKPAIADENRLNELRRIYIKELKSSESVEVFRRHGTAYSIVPRIASNIAPLRNWSLCGAEVMPTYTKLGIEEVEKYVKKRFACFGCPIGCGGVIDVETEGFAVDRGRKPEYEGLAGFGSMCLVDNVEAIAKAHDVCNRAGMDMISASAAVAFAMECYEHGIIGKREAGGIEIDWGNARGMIAMLEKMAKREGLGNILADGVRKAAEHIGKGAGEYAFHVHGQEPGYHTPRLRARCAAYVCDPTPGRHTTGTAPLFAEQMALGLYPELQTPFSDMGETYAIASSYSQTVASSGVCFFLYFVTDKRRASFFPLVECVSAVTGWDFSAAEALKTGKRIQTLRQAFNIREGLQPKDFSMPGRLVAPMPAGPFAGVSIDVEELRRSYYTAMDWDIATGKPSEKSLIDLGLKDLISR